MADETSHRAPGTAAAAQGAASSDVYQTPELPKSVLPDTPTESTDAPAGDETGRSPSTGFSTTAAAKPSADSLLPPEADDRLPEEPAEPPVADDDQLAAAGTGITLHEPVKTIETAEGQLELRQLTREERARRRMIRHLFVIVLAAILLAVAVVVLPRLKPAKMLNQPSDERRSPAPVGAVLR